MSDFRTLIIDDESIARERLIRLLKETTDQINIIGEAKNGIEGAEMINNLKPDLVFLDIQMPGKNGFAMLEDLIHIPKVVFCTAYEEFALKAFNTMALDYLVKPVEKERLGLTMKKLCNTENPNANLHIKELLNLVNNQSENKNRQSLTHKIGDRIILIKTEKITYLSATEKYVEFFTYDGKKYLTDQSLKKLSERLPDNFMQVQRSKIVNLDFVKEYRKYFRGKYILTLDDINSTKLETGRAFSDHIKTYLAY